MPKELFRDENYSVGFAELFFDLVFVFAITQVSHTLLAHYTAAGAVQTGLLFLAIWLVWIYTTWVLNRLDPDQVSVRLLLFFLMLGGVFVAMALPEAFAGRGLIFAVSFTAMQIGRTMFFLLAVRESRSSTIAYGRILIWFMVSASCWVAGGLAEPDMRLWLWLIALGIEFFGALLGFYVPGLGRAASADWTVNGGHIAERCGLFVIICLGESLLVSGATFAGKDWTATGMAAFLASFCATIGMWWVYFHVGYRRGTHQIEHSSDPARLARVVYSYVHILIVAGIVLSAVGAERAIAHPTDPATLAEAASVIGGLALFLLGNGLFKQSSGRAFPRSHLFGLTVCAMAVAVGPNVNLLALNAASAAILFFVAVWEHRSIAAASRS